MLKCYQVGNYVSVIKMVQLSINLFYEVPKSELYLLNKHNIANSTSSLPEISALELHQL